MTETLFFIALCCTFIFLVGILFGVSIDNETSIPVTATIFAFLAIVLALSLARLLPATAPSGLPNGYIDAGSYSYSHLANTDDGVEIIVVKPKSDAEKGAISVFYKLPKEAFASPPVDDYDGGKIDVVEKNSFKQIRQSP